MINGYIVNLPYEDMDSECIELCEKLNELEGIETTECCQGHGKNVYSIFFLCYDWKTLGILYRCVNKNYSDGNFEIVACCSDGWPTNGFWLRSKEILKPEEMEKSVKDLIENINYWTNEKFDEYFTKSTHYEKRQ